MNISYFELIIAHNNTCMMSQKIEGHAAPCVSVTLKCDGTKRGKKEYVRNDSIMLVSDQGIARL